MTDMFGNKLNGGDYIVTAVGTRNHVGYLRIGVLIDDELQWNGVTHKVNALLAGKDAPSTMMLIVPDYSMKISSDQLPQDVVGSLEEKLNQMKRMQDEVRNV